MKKSTNPTNHILISAYTTNDTEAVDFAIIELTETFQAVLHQRLYMANLLSSDKSFHNLCYWDSSCRYYSEGESELYSGKIIDPDEHWAFINLDPIEEQALAIPKNHLEGHQLVIARNGYANFKAVAKYTNEEYFTEPFSISKILKSYDSKSYHSS